MFRHLKAIFPFPFEIGTNHLSQTCSMSSMIGIQPACKAAPVLTSSALPAKLFRQQASSVPPSCKTLQLQSQSPKSNQRLRTNRRQTNQIVASTAVAASSAPKPVAKEFKWGADMKSLGICVAIGVVTWFLPAPAGHPLILQLLLLPSSPMLSLAGRCTREGRMFILEHAFSVTLKLLWITLHTHYATAA